MPFDASFTSGTYTPDKLIAGNSSLLHAIPVTVLAGQTLLRGALLGKITASGKYVLSLTAAVDGSQAPAAILVDDCTAVADKAAMAYIRGDFADAGVTFGAAHTVDTTRDALRDLGIFIVKAQGGV